MKKQPLISVIIPTYKRPDMLGRAINSVINQTYNNWELLVVDDNDANSEYRKETEEFMRKNYGNNKKIKYIKHKKNKGGSAARNTGIKISKGEYIAFLDDDDEWLPEKLEKQLEVFKISKIKNLGLVYCNANYVDENNSTIKKSNYNFRGSNIKKFIIKQDGISNSFLLLKSNVIYEVGGFTEVYSGQDFILELKILSKGFGFDFCNDALVIYHQHKDERISTSKNKIIGAKQYFNILKNFFHDFNIYEKMQAFSNYHYTLYCIYVRRGKNMNALKEILLSIVYNPLNTRKIKAIFRIIFGNKFVDSLKKKIKK